MILRTDVIKFYGGKKMITVPDLVQEAVEFFENNSGKVDAELSAVRNITIKKKNGKETIIAKSFLEKYLYIKEHYANGTFITSDGSIDPEFRAIYLDFYQIKIGKHVTQPFMEDYFALLKESKKWGKWDVHAMHGYVAARLEPYKNLKGQQTYQYSFISKLLHTANNELPIYDQNVWKVVEEKGSPAGTSKMPYAKRINRFVSTLDKIGVLYKGLAKNQTFKNLLGTVTCWSRVKISFVKKCDFIFWVMGDFALKTKKAGKKSGKTSVKGSAAGKGAGTKSGAAANTSGNSTGEANSEENTNIEKERKKEEESIMGHKLIRESFDFIVTNPPYKKLETGKVNKEGLYELEGEQKIEKTLSAYFIIRTEWAFGENGKNFVDIMLDIAKRRKRLTVVDDQIGTPTYCRDLSILLSDIIETQKYGYYNVTNSGGYVSRYEFAKEIFRQAADLGHKEYSEANLSVHPSATEEYGPSITVRPLNSRLDLSKLQANGFTPLPSWEDALSRYLKQKNFYN